jgi:hypothetical protein
MPRFKNRETERKWDEMNELRRNLKFMTPEDCEQYVHGESLFKILRHNYAEKQLKK